VGRDGPLGVINLQASTKGLAVLITASFMTSFLIASAAPTASAATSRRKTRPKTNKPDNRLPFIGSTSVKKLGQGGVGMVLAAKDGAVLVGRVIAGGPAARAGVLAGDRIVEVAGWKLPKETQTGDVAARIRGNVGTRCELTVRRKNVAAPVGLSILRGSMSALFPQAASKVISVTRGLSLIATRGGAALGVQVRTDATSDNLIEYDWAIGRPGAAIGSQPAKKGRGAVSWTAKGATIQIAGWRMELAPRTGAKTMIVRSSNLPLAVVDAAHWLIATPSKLTYVRPRNAPRPYRQAHAGGPCRLRLKTSLDGNPASNRRLTLWLVKDGRHGLPSASTRTNAAGVTTLHVPVGEYRVTGLYSSLNGRGRDLYYEAKLARPDLAIRCPVGGALIDLALPLVASKKPPRPVATSLPTAAATHPFVGRSLPKLGVRKWLGDASKLPRSLRKRAMLVYVWATWCGPCKRVSPLVAELNARLGSKGLVVVSASVDRDGNQLRDFAHDQLEGAAPIAWLGPTAMNQLKVSGIPTMIAVDGRGVVRALHTGTGVGLQAWTTLFKKLLRERSKR
jgi:thiol-disulfide isomerase/thioredoxin